MNLSFCLNKTERQPLCYKQSHAWCVTASKLRKSPRQIHESYSAKERLKLKEHWTQSPGRSSWSVAQLSRDPPTSLICSSPPRLLLGRLVSLGHANLELQVPEFLVPRPAIPMAHFLLSLPLSHQSTEQPKQTNKLIKARTALAPILGEWWRQSWYLTLVW